MNVDFIKERITNLRLLKGVSEYKMSYDLGHSRGYINNISSGKTLPSMTEFLAICDYFEITPAEFFDPGINDPQRASEYKNDFGALKDKDQELISELVRRLRDK